MGRTIAVTESCSLVTGSTSNIGQAIAVAFASEGAQVIVSGRNRERGERIVDGIRAAGGRADFVAADLDGSARRSHDLAAEATRTLGGRIDILVNNAGIFPGTTTASTDEPTVDRMFTGDPAYR
jgi:NAD(P)-dependent dehydrogenase (short-subunit alcohol dehydrogenase family)